MLAKTKFLIQLAHCGMNRAVNILWDTYGNDVMNAAITQAYLKQSDFSLNGLTAEQRRRAIMGETFLLFRRQVLNFDPTRNDDLLGFVIQHIQWHTQTVKRNNTKHDKRETYNVDITDTPDMVEFDKEKDNMFDLKKLVKLIYKRLERKPALRKCLEEYCRACECMDKGEVVEVADRLGCTRASVYNQVKAIRKILEDNSNKQLAEEIWFALAA